MLKELFPKLHRRYSSLPILGPALDDFAALLVQRGYTRKPARRHLCTAKRLDRQLLLQGCHSIEDVTRDHLRDCIPRCRLTSKDPNLAVTARLLERFLEDRGHFVPLPVPEVVDPRLVEYQVFLRQVRGFAKVTITQHLATATAFEADCAADASGARPVPTPDLIERFITATARRVGRATMQHVVAQLRSFLRFLAIRGDVPPGLDLGFS